MVDDFKSIRESLFKVLTGKRSEDDHEDSGASLGLDAGTAKALVGALFARAGKGKDEVVQTMAREIGMAVAAMLKEPLAQLAKNQKLQISFEFVPKAGVTPESTAVAVAPGTAAAKGRAAQKTTRAAAGRKKKD